MAESATAEQCLGAVVVQRSVAAGSELSDRLMRSQQFADVCWSFCRLCFVSNEGDFVFDSGPDWQPVASSARIGVIWHLILELVTTRARLF